MQSLSANILRQRVEIMGLAAVESVHDSLTQDIQHPSLAYSQTTGTYGVPYLT